MTTLTYFKRVFNLSKSKEREKADRSYVSSEKLVDLHEVEQAHENIFMQDEGTTQANKLDAGQTQELSKKLFELVEAGDLSGL